MATLVFFHAHPDDEAIATGGTMRLAADAGHRVVLVFATRGECGEPVEGALAEGEQLGIRRTAECFTSAEVLGAQRVEFLGYLDSGMMGEPTNDNPACFWAVDVESAARRFAAILQEESADVVTVYDDHGGYGHPDHIQVHRVGKRGAELAGTPRVFQSTINRDSILRNIEMAVAAAEAAGESTDDLPNVEDDFGTTEDLITHAVDVSSVIDAKKSAMMAHASQIGADSWFLAMPDEAFAQAFATEWYIDLAAPRSEGADFIDAIF